MTVAFADGVLHRASIFQDHNESAPKSNPHGSYVSQLTKVNLPGKALKHLKGPKTPFSRAERSYELIYTNALKPDAHERLVERP